MDQVVAAELLWRAQDHLDAAEDRIDDLQQQVLYYQRALAEIHARLSATLAQRDFRQAH